jgi:hypothetical protein
VVVFGEKLNRMPSVESHPFKYHLFVSYTTREEEVRAIRPHVERFVKELQQRGFTAWPFWLDVIEIGRFQGSDCQLKEIVRAGIAESIAVLAFVSPGYLTSPFVYSNGTMHG